MGHCTQGTWPSQVNVLLRARKRTLSTHSILPAPSWAWLLASCRAGPCRKDNSVRDVGSGDAAPLLRQTPWMPL